MATFLLADLKYFCRIRECSYSVQTSDFAGNSAKLVETYNESNSAMLS